MKCCVLPRDKVFDLIEQYGSPLYVFHEEEFKNNYLNFLNTFRSIYPKYNIGYSFKTNYTPEIIKIIKNMGGLAEVVSNMEYELAKRLGYSNNEIIYNGPVKGERLFEHLNNGGIANIDNLDELDLVLNHFKNQSMSIKIAFRVNLDIGQGYTSRFGLDTENKVNNKSELDLAFEKIRNFNEVKVVGLHCHIGRARNIEAWQKRVDLMFSLVDKYFKEDGPEFIDFGSGMNSIMEPELASQFTGHIPSYQEYAQVLAGAMNNKYGLLPYEKQPWLYTEPGTTIISGYVTFLSKVLSIKTIKGKVFATFDCSGGNMGDICHLKNLPISVFSNAPKKDYSNVTFVGYTCVEQDYIYRNYNGKLSVGDVVQFRNIGSYSNVLKPPFILPNCAMISIYENGKTKLIKRKETTEDVFQTYIF